MGDWDMNLGQDRSLEIERAKDLDLLDSFHPHPLEFLVQGS
jgi:hypothetical protein